MTTEAAQRAAVVAAARAWKGTPYVLNGRVRGVGTDCGRLLIKVYAECGLMPDIEPGHGVHDFHLNRKEERYLDFVRQHSTEFDGPLGPGDVMLFHYGHSYSHGGIVVEAQPLAIVHALFKAGKVIEERLTKYTEVMAERPGRRPPRYFTLWPPTAERRLPTAP